MIRTMSGAGGSFWIVIGVLIAVIGVIIAQIVKNRLKTRSKPEHQRR